MEWLANIIKIISYTVFRQLSSLFPKTQNEMYALKRQGLAPNEEIPIFDQHMNFLATLPTHTWLFPIGVAAVGLRYRAEIAEQFDLLYGFISNIINSIIGDTYRFSKLIQYIVRKTLKLNI